MAVTEVDRVIATIRTSKDPDEARERLVQLELKGLEAFVRRAGRPESELEAARGRPDYRLSDRQAKAILEMRLSRLTGLEQDKLAAEYGALCEDIARLRAILADESQLLEVIVRELNEVLEKHSEPRRTEIVENEAEIQLEDLIQEEDMVVTISHSGYIKRTPVSAYNAQRRGGKGNRGMEARDDDFVNQLFIASTHSFVFFFSNLGKLYVKKVYEVPLAARNAKGRAIINFIELDQNEKIAAITPVKAFEPGTFMTTITRSGQIKKTEVLEYENYRDKGIIGVKLADDDQLLTATVTDGSADFLIATKAGQSIRFDEEQVRATGRNTFGVKAVDLEGDDVVVGLARTEAERDQVLAVCERGYGKRTPLDEFRVQHRGGKGIILIDATERNGPVVGIALVKATDEVMLITDKGQTIRIAVGEIRETGRNAQGVRLMSVEEDERVVGVELIGEVVTTEDGGAEGGADGGPDGELNGDAEASAENGQGEAPAESGEAPPDDGVPEN
jgi:DNA gyrase subunit A